MSSFANFIARLLHTERRKDGRVPARGVEAFYRTNTEERPARIRDISATGLYLITGERWPPESNVTVILRRKEFLGRSESSQVQIRARVARWGEDGVGLTFVPLHMLPSEWLALMERARSTSWHHDIISRFRSAEAIAFLAVICPEAQQEILLILGDDLCNDRAQRVIDIALNAENLLPEKSALDHIHLAPHLLLRIVEEGSHCSANEVFGFWAGLLASSCLPTNDPTNSMDFIDIFSQLNLMQIRMFSAGCDAAVRKGSAETSDGGPIQICFTREEIRKIARTHNLTHVERDLQQLHSLGLLEQTRKTLLLGEIEQANLTPTHLGMQLYSRCCGQTFGLPND